MGDIKQENRITLLSSRELMNQCFRDIEHNYSIKDKSVYSVLTGCKGLDDLMHGLHHSDLIVIAGLPGAGKSAFVHNLINLIAQEGHSVLLCSPEMNKEMIILRLLSMESGVSFRRLECGCLDDRHWPGITSAAGTLSDVMIHIDGAVPLKLTRLIEMANGLKNEKKLDLLVVDSLPFLVLNEKELGSSTTEIMMALKVLARDLKIPVIITLPVASGCSDKSASCPTLLDIQDDCIVNMADVIIMFHNTGINPDRKFRNVDTIIAKNRNGAKGVVSFRFYGKCLRFVESQDNAQITLGIS